ncbi:MAG TPA: ribbon-helix-helix protein, CopG family [Longimicrobiales bacterium]|nr:ribbon-helix-helix protein, CopG family [Longimicrobiales bacterium]
MPERIHIVVDPSEKERFRLLAEREGKSLSAWLRDAARERAAAAASASALDTEQALRDFFAACDEREVGTEPGWEHHRRVIEDSVRSGAAGT